MTIFLKLLHWIKKLTLKYHIYNYIMNYLSSVNIEPYNNKNYPFNLQIFKNGLSIDFKSPITFILGENGFGKSTFLESLSYFNILS